MKTSIKKDVLINFNASLFKGLTKPDNTKLILNKRSKLDLFVILKNNQTKKIQGEFCNIIRKTEKDTLFQKLYNTVSKKGNIPLIKCINKEGKTSWLKSNFKIISNNEIKFEINERINIQKTSINKLIDTLDAIESNLNSEIGSKYLTGFLEEKGVKTFNEYVQHHI